MVRNTDVLIVGGGFGGLSCFRHVDRQVRQTHLLSDRNHFLFTPLLPLAATGAVEVRSIVEPLWSFQRGQNEILIGDAIDLDPRERRLLVKFEPGQPQQWLPFRSLVLAVGATTATYGIPGVEAHCHFFKQMKDARALREKILASFERAATAETADDRARALRFLVIGGGATGVELACEIHDLITLDLARDFPALAPLAEIEIIEAREEILGEFDRTLAEYARHKLRQKRIRLRTGTRVQEVEAHRALLGEGVAVEADTLIWTAGIGPSPFLQRVAEQLGVTLVRGRLPVRANLAVTADFPEIYALGDCASMPGPGGQPLPPTAQVAMRQGVFLARELSRRAAGTFEFRSLGMLASLGSGAAIADLGFLRIKGRLAWWFWKAAYLTRLVSLRNKATVAFDWVKVLFFGRNTARIDF